MSRGRVASVRPDAPADDQALQEFQQRYSDVRFGPLAIVIPAYNEAENITQVVQALPTTVCGLNVSVLVVDDGSADGTAEVARAAGAFVCAPVQNRGQGAAFRLGYWLARDRGAWVIATTDADGQYDSSQFDRIVEPIVRGEADFVTGSRKLGTYTTDDSVRHAGVVFYARVLSVLTKRRVTDTSNGFRAFHADVLDHIVLDQPQYQATELLLGVIYRGFRWREVPTSMHQRTGGSSKKGNNLLYGYRFGRVITGTWLRELRRNRREGRRLASPGPALHVPPPARTAGQRSGT